MADEADSTANIDRLLGHLKDESLARRLVRAYQAPDTGDPAASIKAVLAERLEQVRAKLNGAPD